MQDQIPVTNINRKRPVNKSSQAMQHAVGMGKLPPQAIDLEEAVLGALMIEKEALNTVIDVLHPESFYKEAHQRIFKAIHYLFHNTEPVDILTVTQTLKKSGELDMVGGPFYITQLTNRVASSANIEYHARIILEKFIQRELIRISSETIKDAYEDTSDVLMLLDKAEKNLFAIAEGNLRRNYEDIKALIHKSFKKIEEASHQTTGVTGVSSGFTELDRITSGWQKADLIIMAARPGMGKTAFVLSLARNAAIRFSKPVAFFSLEMSSVQLVNRLISSETEIISDKLRKGQLANHEWEQLHSKIVPLTEAPIYIDDTPSLSILELRAKCRRLVAERKVELIIIDYLQLMVAGFDNRNFNREQEISTISRSLKSIAKELDVPIIALSQLSRAVESRGGSKKPQLSDLRESGAIEQDADMVMFIYRPEYYGLTEDEQQQNMNGLAEIIVAKNRNGALDTIKLRFISNLTKFVELNEFDLGNENMMGSQQNSPSDRITMKSRINDVEDAPPF